MSDGKNCFPGVTGLVRGPDESRPGVVVATAACIAINAMGDNDPSPSTIWPRSSRSGSRIITPPPVSAMS
jgi:hypothetical protein